MIGPYDINKIVLCSADAGPNSQKTMAGEAQYFFPGAKWVGATRNTAQAMGCKFVILTTAHGMVNSEEKIAPYNKHINSRYRAQVIEKWHQTIPQVLGNRRYELIVFYAGGCPRESYLEVLMPILRNLDVSLITFGKPNMVDSGKIEDTINLLRVGATIDTFRNILKYPDRLKFYK